MCDKGDGELEDQSRNKVQALIGIACERSCSGGGGGGGGRYREGREVVMEVQRAN